LLAAFQLVF